MSPSSEPRLLESPFNDPEVAAAFSDEVFIQQMVAVESALARAQAKVGVLPPPAGEVITSKLAGFRPDNERLRAGLARDGVPVIELVRQLRDHVGGDEASYLHYGATSQDIMDTALVLQVRSVLEGLEGSLQAVIADLAGLADRHRHTMMAGRTHAQQAVPIPFGLKVAGWLAPLLRHRQRLVEIKPRVLVIQLGGAAGTLAPMGANGAHVQEALAEQLDLGVPPMPWHTQRDALAELAGWLSLVSGSLAKMAQDVILLAQSEVGEARETGEPNRGGSSTMPQKRNPITSEQILACARVNASLLSSMHHALVQEHERGTHGWQVEWLALPRMFELTAAALHKAAILSERLEVDAERMSENMSLSNGLMLAEAISFALSSSIGRVEARKLVQEACRVAAAERRHLIEVISEMTDASVDWEGLKEAGVHQGSSQAFIDRVLAQAAID